MSRLCLDTSAYSHWKRGHAKAADLVDTAEWVGIPCVVLGELYAGFEGGAHAEKNMTELEDLLASPVVEVLTVDHEVARVFGSIVGELRRQGTPLPINDVWIAATCARAGATLLTFDAHFRRIGRIGTLVLE